VDNVKSGTVLGIPIVGTDADLPRLRRSGFLSAFVALGDNHRRLGAARLLRQLDFQIVNAISPAALVSASTEMGVGVAVMPGAVLNAQCKVEDFVIINTGAVVDHDVYLGEASHVGPACALAGGVRIGRLAFLGTGAKAIPGVSVGEEAIIGAGACVINDIPARALAVGVPARIRPRRGVDSPNTSPLQDRARR
jgi:UDP-perosamine 4-acetyltransferase